MILVNGIIQSFTYLALVILHYLPIGKSGGSLQGIGFGPIGSGLGSGFGKTGASGPGAVRICFTFCQNSVQPPPATWLSSISLSCNFLLIIISPFRTFYVHFLQIFCEFVFLNLIRPVLQYITSWQKNCPYHIDFIALWHSPCLKAATKARCFTAFVITILPKAALTKFSTHSKIKA